MVQNTYKNKNFTVAPRNNMGEKKNCHFELSATHDSFIRVWSSAER